MRDDCDATRLPRARGSPRVALAPPPPSLPEPDVAASEQLGFSCETSPKHSRFEVHAHLGASPTITF